MMQHQDHRSSFEEPESSANRLIHGVFGAAVAIAAVCVVVTALQMVFLDRSQNHSGVPLWAPPQMVTVGGFAFLLAAWLFCQEQDLDPLFRQTETGRRPRLLVWVGLAFYIAFIALLAVITWQWWA